MAESNRTYQTMETELNPTRINTFRAGFKRRQYTPYFFIMYFVFSVGFISAAVTIFIGLWGDLWIGILYMGIAIIMFAFSLGCLWCEVEDLGSDLCVTFGPLQAVFCNMGQAIIPYNQIKTYYAPTNCYEGCCGYGIAKINKAVDGGIRQHSLCSCDCREKQMVIQYRNPQTMCAGGWCNAYTKIVIAVSGSDYQALKKMLDEKFNVVTKI
eukprot:271880_1